MVISPQRYGSSFPLTDRGVFRVDQREDNERLPSSIRRNARNATNDQKAKKTNFGSTASPSYIRTTQRFAIVSLRIRQRPRRRKNINDKETRVRRSAYVPPTIRQRRSYAEISFAYCRRRQWNRPARRSSGFEPPVARSRTYEEKRG